jgi:hypothetical protein
MAYTAELLNLNIAAAGSGVGSVFVPNYCKAIALQCVFAYGSGGTSAKAYVQTTFDGGVTWVDIACFAATTASLQRLFNLVSVTPKTSIVTPTDGSLGDNTCVDGLIGTQLRVKYVTVGTYTGSTNLKVQAVIS